jgi:hypothetical protein
MIHFECVLCKQFLEGQNLMEEYIDIFEGRTMIGYCHYGALFIVHRAQTLNVILFEGK